MWNTIASEFKCVGSVICNVHFRSAWREQFSPFRRTDNGTEPYVCLSFLVTNTEYFCTGLTLRMPILSTTPSHSAFSPGEKVQFICSVPQRISITATFDLYMGGSSIMTQAVESTQTRVIFTLSSLQSAHQGRYSCRQQITQNGQNIISSSSSNSMDITIGE